MEFEWDKSKAAANLKKHGVSFEEAKTFFGNSLTVIFDDEAHSIDEQQEIIIGHSQQNRPLAKVPNTPPLTPPLTKGRGDKA